MSIKLNTRQRELLSGFKDLHDDGIRSPPYYKPFGMTRLHLGGEGQAMSGLLRRGLVEEVNRIMYITETGLAAIGSVTKAHPHD